MWKTSQGVSKYKISPISCLFWLHLGNSPCKYSGYWNVLSYVNVSKKMKMQNSKLQTLKLIRPIYVWGRWWFCTKSVSAKDAHPHFCHFFLVSCWSWLLTIQRRRRELVRLFQLLWAAANWLIGLTRGRGCILCLLTSFSCIPATFVSLSDLEMFYFSAELLIIFMVRVGLFSFFELISSKLWCIERL